MSLPSWLDKYYPTPALAYVGYQQRLERDPSLTDRQVVELPPPEVHSLRKWEGLEPEVLRQHSLMRDELTIIEYPMSPQNRQLQLDIDGRSCALCVVYYIEDEGVVALGNPCLNCPLNKALGHPCDLSRPRSLSPYNHWIETGDPSLMIAALRMIQPTPQLVELEAKQENN